MDITISDIIDGSRTSTRNVGDDITIEDIWDTYVHVPGARAIIDKPIEAIYHNGFENFDLDRDRMDEIQKVHIFRDLFGYSAIIFKKNNIQAWNPKCNGIGFVITSVDDLGRATEIEVYNSSSTSFGMGTKISKGGFIILRTPEGLAGDRGLSRLLSLIDVLRVQHEIYTEYAKYAFHQGLAHPLLKIKGLDDTKYAKAQAALSAPTKDDAVIIDMEDDFDYKSPQANAYNPVPLLEYGDTFVTRASQLNRLQWYGDPTGVLAASETATANWYAHIKEEQDRIISQIKPILVKLGAPDNVQFNDPAEYNIQTQMQGVINIRAALEGLVPREQVVNIINKYLGLEEDEKLTPKEEEPKETLEDKENEKENDKEEEIKNERTK